VKVMYIVVDEMPIDCRNNCILCNEHEASGKIYCIPLTGNDALVEIEYTYGRRKDCPLRVCKEDLK
jgi:hypothetical protein